MCGRMYARRRTRHVPAPAAAAARSGRSRSLDLGPLAQTRRPRCDANAQPIASFGAWSRYVPLVPGTLFHRVARYRPTGRLDPRENRLTEITAAVLERVPGLTAAVAAELAGTQVATADRSDRDEPAEVSPRTLTHERARTQVTVDGRFVDLVLSHVDAAGTAQDLYVEIKHGSGEHGDQIEAYLERAARTGALVALLVPGRDAPAIAAVPRPSPVRVTSWQTLARRIRQWAKTAELTAVEQWLIDEYLTYLSEEDLMDPEALTTVHALALAEHGAASAAMRAICARADTWLGTNWGPRGTHSATTAKPPVPKHGQGYWAHYPSSHDKPDERWSPGWLEWGLRDLSDAQYADDLVDLEDVLFCAGASFEAADRPSASDTGRAWVETLGRSGFVTFWHGYYRVMRVLSPSDLLRFRSIEDQGDEVGRWAAETFRLLWEHGPPAG